MKPARRLVLLVEDNIGDVELFGERLADAPTERFDLVRAGSLAEATERLAGATFDVVILDLNLPDSSGLETLRRVKAVAADSPVVIVSGHVTDEVREQALREGADEIFGKDESNSRLFSRAILYVIERSHDRLAYRELDRVLSTIPDAILVAATTGEVRYVNEAALALFGRKREDFVGELLTFSIKEGQPTDVTILRGPDNLQCEIRVAQIEWGKAPCLLAVLRDVTEQRKMEMQLALSDRMVSIGTLAAGVAHEINNPLASVIANLDIAGEEVAELTRFAGVNSELGDELRDAKDAASRILQIVRDLKMFSRAEDDRRGPVDVHRVVESSIRMAWNEIRHRARLVRDFGRCPVVEANDARLGQVFLNLLVNAAQAIPEGDANHNEIRVVTGRDAAGRATVEISDTGCGIPDDVQKRMFAAFFTTKPIGVGTGLGLAISHRIVTALGGEISFESEVGRGTTFRVMLPAGQPGAVPPDPQPLYRPARGRRGRVLVIDDDDGIAQAVRRALAADHEVTTVREAERALALLRQERHFDVILCDIMMPQVTGMEFFETLKFRDESQARRVVFMTGGAFTPTARVFLDGVPNHHIEKPFDIQELRALVRELSR